MRSDFAFFAKRDLKSLCSVVFRVFSKQVKMHGTLKGCLGVLSYNYPSGVRTMYFLRTSSF